MRGESSLNCSPKLYPPGAALATPDQRVTVPQALGRKSTKYQTCQVIATARTSMPRIKFCLIIQNRWGQMNDKHLSVRLKKTRAL